MIPPSRVLLLEDANDLAVWMLATGRAPRPKKWCKDEPSEDDDGSDSFERYGPR